MSKLDWQLSKNNDVELLQAVGEQSIYNIIISPTGVYLVAKSHTGLTDKVFTPKGEDGDCIRECKRIANRWNK